MQKQLETEIVKADFKKLKYPSIIMSKFVVEYILDPKNEKTDSNSYARSDAGSC